MKEEYCALIRYGIELLRNRLGLNDPIRPSGELADLIFSLAISDSVEARVQRSRAILLDNFPESILSTTARLVSVFCKIRYHLSDEMMDPYHLPLKRLGSDLNEWQDENPQHLWDAFSSELKLILPGSGAFESFCALIRKYGWYVPGATPYDSISVFEQFKAIAALTFCTPDEGTKEALLVAGDIPGIQTILFTITSAGAAKSLRGRSFYLQLLNDAIVRTILRELKLPSPCVIYNAGGNFKLLLPLECAPKVDEICAEINRRLLLLHNGEISFAHAYTSIFLDDVSEPSKFGEANITLNNLLQDSKKQPFALLAPKAYGELFGIKGVGRGERCDVCHFEARQLHPKGEKRLCDQCRSFEDLARLLAGAGRDPWLSVSESELPLSEIPDQTAKIDERTKWENALFALGCSYSIGKRAKNTKITSLYRLNDTADFIPQQASPEHHYGFLFVSRLTPRIEENEIEELKKCLGAEAADLEQKDNPIRDTRVMAGYDATGIRRYGVLRMDLDSLGEVFSTRLVRNDMLHVSALSAQLSLFFDGFLDGVCTDAAERWKDLIARTLSKQNADKKVKDPYILYAGGDDLLMVGPWDVLPYMSCEIRRAFGSYVTAGWVNREEEPASSPLTLSAGLFAETEKFPLYRAADLAKEALSAAKRYGMYQEKGGENCFINLKDAVTWLDYTLDWKDFRQAFALALKLAGLMSRNNGQGAPRSLLWLLHEVGWEYQENVKLASPGQKVYGSWMWKLAYGFSQLKDRLRKNAGLVKEISQIIGECYDVTRPEDMIKWPTVRFIELPVRWAELLIRKES